MGNNCTIQRLLHETFQSDLQQKEAVRVIYNLIPFE